MNRASRGQSLTEFALILPVFLLVTIGLLDMGRAIYAYNTVSNAARGAARVAIVDQDPTAVTQAAIEHAPGLGLSDSDVTYVSCPQDDCQISVTVTYDFEPVTPLVGDIFHPTISATSKMPIEVPNP